MRSISWHELTHAGVHVYRKLIVSAAAAHDDGSASDLCKHQHGHELQLPY
jgi:hypothetical protein